VPGHGKGAIHRAQLRPRTGGRRCPPPVGKTPEPELSCCVRAVGPIRRAIPGGMTHRFARECPRVPGRAEPPARGMHPAPLVPGLLPSRGTPAGGPVASLAAARAAPPCRAAARARPRWALAARRVRAGLLEAQEPIGPCRCRSRAGASSRWTGGCRARDAGRRSRRAGHCRRRDIRSRLRSRRNAAGAGCDLGDVPFLTAVDSSARSFAALRPSVPPAGATGGRGIPQRPSRRTTKPWYTSSPRSRVKVM
jgi:hypothetical protein